MSDPETNTPSRQQHWEKAYLSSDPERVSWYRETLEISLDLIAGSGLGTEIRVIDVGGGASTLVDHLLERGYAKLSVLDIAGPALAASRARLGSAGDRVEWLRADITRWRPSVTYDIWHDRAVFHFLTDAADRAAYVAAMDRALAPGGRAIIATFAPEGPEKCSGLPVVRYAPEALAAELGSAFTLLEFRHEAHYTPAGKPQAFVYCNFARAGD